MASESEDEGISDLNDQCINPDCTNENYEMMISANHHHLNHYKHGINERLKICEPCYDIFDKENKKSGPVLDYDDDHELRQRMADQVKRLLDASDDESTESGDSDIEMLGVALGIDKEEKGKFKYEDFAEMEKLEKLVPLMIQKACFQTNPNQNTVKSEEVLVKSDPSISLDSPLFTDQMSRLSSSEPSSLKDSGPSSPQEVLTPSRPSSPEEPLPELPPIGLLERPPLTVGESAFAMRPNNDQDWKMCKILETKSGSSEYKIHFEGILSKKTTANRNVSAKHLAYFEPSKFMLPVGTRCIALYTEDPDYKVDFTAKQNYFAAIIAELPNLKNSNRYLVFFDDGYTAYMTHDELRVVAESSEETWKDVQEGPQQDFIRNYLDQFPKCPNLRLKLDDEVEALVSDDWVLGRVADLDANLVKLDFGDGWNEEWIYVGSPRLMPIFRMEELKREKGLKGFEGVVPPEDTRKEQKEVACFERKGHLVSEETYNEPKKFELHDCDWKCITGPGLGYKDGDDLEDNLLMIPIKHGWTRRVFQYYELEKRCVEYIAPCGRRLRTLEEVQFYLKLTTSQMEVDFFNVDWWVHVQHRFQPDKELVTMPDMSFNQENVPVSLVNSVNYEYPEFLKYSKVRLPQDNVKIPLDPEFMVCCDCEDDCSDETKCQCRMLTRKEAGDDVVVAGYEFKRLKDNVLTGIYECNQSCRCKHNCHNRVAQKPLRGKLQMFKTTKSGWGIRTLVDIPQGTFICIYVGHLYVSDEADKLDSDAYFAQLDMIEVAEMEKGGYVHDDDEGFGDGAESVKSVNISQVDGGAESVKSVNITQVDGGAETAKSVNIRQVDGGVESAKSVNISQVDGANSESDMEVEPEKEKSESSDKTEESSMEIEPEKEKNSEFTQGSCENGEIEPEKDKNSEAKEESEKSGESNMEVDPVTALAWRRYESLENKEEKAPEPLRLKSVRKCFSTLEGRKEEAYVMDAKQMGNIGRYMNHSCNPNVFVQNVFVDTHDLRFPWVAFFASTFIKAGSELCWNYNYELLEDSTPLMCNCGSSICKGRLL